MATKQEQEPAREEVTEVARGVLRMELPIRIPGLAHVNCYALLDDRGATLVDPGLPGRPTWKALQDRLRRAGLSPKHVHTTIVTHSHPDHFGGAGILAKTSGCEVVGHHRFSFGPPKASDLEPEVSLDALPPPDPNVPRFVPNRTPWGKRAALPRLAMRLRWRLDELLMGAPFEPTITRPVGDDERIELAGREWRVIHTPGHTGDHICFHDPEEGVFLSGDHVLPTITPHISGMTRVADPLKAFFESLDRVAEIPGVKTVLPAHGHPFPDLAGRARDIKLHHDERLVRVKTIGRDIGPGTVEDFSKHLFRQRHWGWMAESETFAHLEHLRCLGEAEAHRNGDGLLVYETG